MAPIASTALTAAAISLELLLWFMRPALLNLAAILAARKWGHQCLNAQTSPAADNNAFQIAKL